MRWGPTSRRRRVSLETPPRGTARPGRSDDDDDDDRSVSGKTTNASNHRRRWDDESSAPRCDGETTARTYSRGLQSRTGDGRFGGRFAIPRARSGASRELLRVFVWNAGVAERLDRYRDGERVVSWNGTFWGGVVLYARDERESDDLKAQILLTCYVLKQPRDVPTLARRPRVRERLCTETRRFVVVSRNRLFSI